jgi:hypothetical protein
VAMTSAEKHQPKFDRYLSDRLEAEIKQKTAVGIRLTSRTLPIMSKFYCCSRPRRAGLLTAAGKEKPG